MERIVKTSVWYHEYHTAVPDYTKITERKVLKETFTHYPFAVINIIKDIGAGITSTAELKKYAIENTHFLKEQLDILHPDIIVCCGNGVFDIVNQSITPPIESSGNWLKYNAARNIIFLILTIRENQMQITF